MLKFKIGDPELEAGTIEIYEKCKKETSKSPQPASEQMIESSDDWGTESEEDASNDDADMKDVWSNIWSEFISRLVILLIKLADLSNTLLFMLV